MQKQFVPLKTVRDEIRANNWATQMYTLIGVPLKITGVVDVPKSPKYPKGYFLDDRGHKWPVNHCALIDDGDYIEIKGIPYDLLVQKTADLLQKFDSMFPEHSSRTSRAFAVRLDIAERLNNLVKLISKQSVRYKPNILEDMISNVDLTEKHIDEKLKQVKEFIVQQKIKFETGLLKCFNADSPYFRDLPF